MTIDIKRSEQAVRLRIGGRLDTTTAPALESTLKNDIGNVLSLTFDMRGLEYISSAGLRVLLGAQKRLDGVGEMKLTGVGDEVMEVFRMTGFADALAIEE